MSVLVDCQSRLQRSCDCCSLQCCAHVSTAANHPPCPPPLHQQQLRMPRGWQQLPLSETRGPLRCRTTPPLLEAPFGGTPAGPGAPAWWQRSRSPPTSRSPSTLYLGRVNCVGNGGFLVGTDRAAPALLKASPPPPSCEPKSLAGTARRASTQLVFPKISDKTTENGRIWRLGVEEGAGGLCGHCKRGEKSNKCSGRAEIQPLAR